MIYVKRCYGIRLCNGHSNRDFATSDCLFSGYPTAGGDFVSEYPRLYLDYKSARRDRFWKEHVVVPVTLVLRTTVDSAQDAWIIDTSYGVFEKNACIVRIDNFLAWRRLFDNENRLQKTIVKAGCSNPSVDRERLKFDVGYQSVKYVIPEFYVDWDRLALQDR